MIKSLKGRLTLWYTLLFALVSLGVFFAIYLVLTRDLNTRMDEELIDDAKEIIYIYEKSGLRKASAEILLEIDQGDQEIGFYRIFSPSLELLAATDLGDWQGLSSMPEIVPEQGQMAFKFLSVAEHEFEVRSIFSSMAGGYILQIGFEPIENGILFRLFRKTFVAAFFILVFIGAISGFLISRFALKGIDRLRDSVDQASHGNFTRVTTTGREGEEIRTLIQTFNRMQNRIQALIHELTNVTNNVAHDLRSPVTRIRGIAETTLTGSQELCEYQEAAGSIIEDCDTLVGMINTMLEIAEADAGATEISFSEVDISRMLLDVSDIFLPVAEDKGVGLFVNLPHSSIDMQGDKIRLQRALANLLDNAIKYTPAGGKVTLSALSDDSAVTIRVQDSGIGISEPELERIFNRFYRCDPSRSTPGNGLGLALVRSISRLHHGEIKVTSAVNEGSSFVLRLPVHTD